MESFENKALLETVLSFTYLVRQSNTRSRAIFLQVTLTPRRLEGQYIVPPTNNAEYWYLIGPLECYQPLMTKHLAFFKIFNFSAHLERLGVKMQVKITKSDTIRQSNADPISPKPRL